MPKHEFQRMTRSELIGKRAKLSNGDVGEIVMVEYETPARVAYLVQRDGLPRPILKAGVDRASPPHLPRIIELVEDSQPTGDGTE